MGSFGIFANWPFEIFVPDIRVFTGMTITVIDLECTVPHRKRIGHPKTLVSTVKHKSYSGLGSFGIFVNWPHSVPQRSFWQLTFLYIVIGIGNRGEIVVKMWREMDWVRLILTTGAHSRLCDSEVYSHLSREILFSVRYF